MLAPDGQEPQDAGARWAPAVLSRGLVPTGQDRRSAGAEVRARVDRLALDPDLPVQVRARGVAGAADEADDLAARDLVAHLDVERALVTVERAQGVAVVDHGAVAVAVLDVGDDDDAVGRGPD